MKTLLYVLLLVVSIGIVIVWELRWMMLSKDKKKKADEQQLLINDSMY